MKSEHFGTETCLLDVLTGNVASVQSRRPGAHWILSGKMKNKNLTGGLLSLFPKMNSGQKKKKTFQEPDFFFYVEIS